MRTRGSGSRPTWVCIGSNTWLHVSRVIAYVDVGSRSRSIRRWLASMDPSRVVDVTGGKRTRSVVVTDSSVCFLSSVDAQTLAVRSAGKEG